MSFTAGTVIFLNQSNGLWFDRNTSLVKYPKYK